MLSESKKLRHTDLVLIVDIEPADLGEDIREVIALVLEAGWQGACHGQKLPMAELTIVDDGAVGSVGASNTIVGNLM